MMEVRLLAREMACPRSPGVLKFLHGYEGCGLQPSRSHTTIPPRARRKYCAYFPDKKTKAQRNPLLARHCSAGRWGRGWGRGENWGSNSQARSSLLQIKKRKCRMHPPQDTLLSRPQTHA